MRYMPVSHVTSHTLPGFAIATLFFGLDLDGARLASLLSWLAHARGAAPGARLLVVSDDLAPKVFEAEQLRLSAGLPAHRSPANKTQAFDLKGRLLCAAALSIPEPFLYLDLDALLVAEPRPICSPANSRAAFGMPLDFGSIRRPLLECPSDPALHGITKRCAGVLYFGDIAWRRRLVNEYRKAFFTLRARHASGLLAEERRLLEQWAWSVVFHRLPPAARIALPDAFNWPAAVWPHNPDAVVAHYYGDAQKEALKGLISAA